MIRFDIGIFKDGHNYTYSITVIDSKGKELTKPLIGTSSGTELTSRLSVNMEKLISKQKQK